MSESMDPGEERQAFKAARKQAADARNWRYNQGYEDGLKLFESDPERFATLLSANHRTAILAFYKPMRDAAEAAGFDVTQPGGSR